MRRPPHLQVLLDLRRSRVPFVLVGAMAALHYAEEGSNALMTFDADILVRPTARALGAALKALGANGYAPTAGGEPLGPVDPLLLKRMVEHKAVVRAKHPKGLAIDLMLEARPFPFETWFAKRRLFRVDGGTVVCASLEMVLEAKRTVGRPKDKAFLAAFRALKRS